jgi:hypothetical protein
MASQQIRVIVIRDVKELKNAQPAPSDMVCIIVPDVKFVYRPLERINTRMVVIGNDTFSETVSIKLYQKYMTKYKLKHMALILNTELTDNDIHEMCKRVNPDDVIRLD